MRYHFFLHYGWFFQNLGKEAVRTFMHTTVAHTHAYATWFQMYVWYTYMIRYKKYTFNPNWHELRKQEKCSSLVPPRSKFYKTQWAWQGVKLTRLMSIFTSKKVWKLLIKIHLTKSDPKRTRGRKVPCLMPIRVKYTLWASKVPLNPFRLLHQIDTSTSSFLAKSRVKELIKCSWWWFHLRQNDLFSMLSKST